MPERYDPKYWPKSNAADNQIAVIMLQFKNGDHTLDEARKLVDEQVSIIKEEYSDFMIDGGMYI